MKIAKFVILIVVFIFLAWLINNLFFSSKILTPFENKDRFIEKEKFSILLPKDWKEISSMDKSINFSAQNNNPTINFHITSDTIKEEDKDNYLLYVKQSILKVLPEAKIILENKNEIKALLSHNGNNYKSWIKVNFGNDNDVYLLTFNSLESDWKDNEPIFEKIAKSFEIKK
jgi:hypothetical protein